MMKVTLDTNCIVALEEKQESATAIQALIEMCDAGQIQLRIPAISASEKQKGNTYLSNFEDFQRRLAAAGLRRAELLFPLAYPDITYWDCCLLGDEALQELERRIHFVLFPKIEYLYAEFRESRHLGPLSEALDPKWRNAKCDVLALWSHIHYSGDVFVTDDNNFHRKSKKPLLVALGAKVIVRPPEAVLMLQR